MPPRRLSSPWGDGARVERVRGAPENRAGVVHAGLGERVGDRSIGAALGAVAVRLRERHDNGSERRHRQHHHKRDHESYAALAPKLLSQEMRVRWPQGISFAAHGSKLQADRAYIPPVAWRPYPESGDPGTIRRAHLPRHGAGSLDRGTTRFRPRNTLRPRRRRPELRCGCPIQENWFRAGPRRGRVGQRRSDWPQGLSSLGVSG